MRLLRSSGAPGADGPNGLVGNDNACHVVSFQAGEGGAHLRSNEIQMVTLVANVQGLAYADNGLHAACDQGLHLGVHLLIGLAEILPALGMADDAVSAADLLDHVDRNLTGIGA